MTMRRLFFVIHRCPGGKCPTDNFEESPIETTPRFWSKYEAWDCTEERLALDPLCGIPTADNKLIIIHSGWNMFLDVPLKDLPAFTEIEIRGRLSFKEDMDHHLKVNRIKIRGGELKVGLKDKPMQKKVTIELTGGKESEAIALQD
jgi:hypothetical protein